MVAGVGSSYVWLQRLPEERPECSDGEDSAVVQDVQSGPKQPAFMVAGSRLYHRP